jgi:hypothetical protein
MSNKLADKSAISERAVAKLAAGSSISAIVPTNIEEVFRLAELVHQSGLAPWSLKSPAAVTVVFLKGLEIGLPPMAALENIGVINGKAALHSDGIPALLWARGFKIKEWYVNEADIENCEAHVKITRPEGDDYEFKYTAADARENGLWQTQARVKNKEGKDVPNTAPWFLYKKRMIRMRARGWLARDCASDVLKGIPIFEEQQDIANMRDITPRSAVLAVPTDIPDGTEEPTPDPEVNQDGPLPNPDKYLAHLETQLAEAEDKEQLQEIWAAHQELEDRLSEADRDTAVSFHTEQGKRFEPQEAQLDLEPPADKKKGKK